MGIAAMLVASIAAFAATFACAHPGQRDEGFGSHGIAGATLESSYRGTRFTAVAESSGGDILASRDGTVERYSALGVRDMSFQAGSFDFPSGLRVTQSDGKVLVLGDNGGIKRLLSDGSPDPSFNGGESEAPRMLAQAIAVSDSGEIFVAGLNYYTVVPKGCGCQPAVARFNPDGTLDKSFGNAGSTGLYTDLGVSVDQLRGLAPQGDGGVVVVSADAVLKLTAAGKLDTAYGDDGKVGPRSLSIIGFRAFPGDALELAGTIETSSGGSTFFAARYSSSGHLDPDFAGGRLATIDFGGDALAQTARFGADGSILLGGAASTTPNACITFDLCNFVPALARFTDAGVPDEGFGDDGRVRIGTLPVGNPGIGVLSLLVRDDGGIIAAGSAGRADLVAFIAALGPGGTLQPAFGEGGLVTERRPEPSEQSGDPVVEIGPDRSIYAAVPNSAGAVYSRPSVIRYRRDGRLDRSFGGGRGYVSARTGDEATALAVDERGGSVLLSNPNQVYRFTPNGRVDRRFAAGQPVLLRSAPAHFRDVAIQTDGKILVAGTSSWLSASGRMLIARLLPNGRLDPRFGHGGYAAMGCERRGRCKAARILVRHDGRILLAGSVTHRGGTGRNGELSRIALAQLLPDGRPDPDFGNEGFLALKLDHSLATSLALSRGRILVGALAQTGHGIRGLVARLLPDGRLDRSFAGRGFLRAFPKSTGVPSELLPTETRLIVVTDAVGFGPRPSKPVLGFRSDGHPDPSYRRLSPRALMPGVVSGPGAARQGGRVVLAWTQTNRPKGGGDGLISLRLTRLND